MSAFGSFCNENEDTNDILKNENGGSGEKQQQDIIVTIDDNQPSQEIDNLSFCSGTFGAAIEPENHENREQSFSPNPFAQQYNNPFGSAQKISPVKIEEKIEFAECEQQGSSFQAFADVVANPFGGFGQEEVKNRPDSPKKTLYEKLGIQKLPARPKLKKENSTKMEFYPFVAYVGENDLEYKKVEKLNKSNMGNKTSTRQGFAFQSVMKERVTQSRSRFTIGHKTPLQRRLLIRQEIYDPKAKPEESFNPFGQKKVDMPNPFSVVFDGPVRDRGAKINQQGTPPKSPSSLSLKAQKSEHKEDPIIKKISLQERLKKQSGWGS